MAKSSGKKSFRDTVEAYQVLSKQIASHHFAPVYLLMGEEPYFIDSLTHQLAENILSEEEKACFLGGTARTFYGFKDLVTLPYIKNMSE